MYSMKILDLQITQTEAQAISKYYQDTLLGLKGTVIGEYNTFLICS